MTAIMAALAVAITIVVFAAIFTALDVFLALSVEKATRRESLLCETKKFEIMNGIMFAKEHMGEYFQYEGVTVRIVGFEFLGKVENIIVAGYPNGWFQISISPDDNILVDLDPEERLYYVQLKDLAL